MDSASLNTHPDKIDLIIKIKKYAYLLVTLASLILMRKLKSLNYQKKCSTAYSHYCAYPCKLLLSSTADTSYRRPT